ncbi:prohead protease inhibitor [Vibrio phage vB_ValM_R10Z]|nr:prohead protease inhibitor [Vibrio phage vB_ValM_R10Z]
MSQLKTHAESLTKAELDEFAKEYYGVELDRRKSKGAMAKKLVEEAETKTPLKQLPWEELLVETEDKPDPIVETKPVETKEVVVELPKDDSFEPMPLPFRRGREFFMTASDSAVKSAKAIIAGDGSLDDVLASDLRVVKSILHYVDKDGKVLVRETRNSQFITIK